jgi:hypothetical protein
MLGRTPGNIVAIKPMKDGVIADFEVTEKMLTYFIKKAHNRNVWVRPRIVIGVPVGDHPGREARGEGQRVPAKASEVHLVEEAMAAAIGAGMPITEPSGNMIVDIGGGTTDIAGHLACRYRLQQGGAGCGQRDGRGDHPVHQEDVQPADRRAHRPKRSRWRSARPTSSTSG